MPPLHQDPQSLETPPKAPAPRATYLGLATLLLIGAASFFAAFAYFDSLQPRATQAAAAATRQSAFDGIYVEARAAIVVDLNSGAVLYEKNADAVLPLASITKVPLALAVAEVLDPEKIITIPYDTGYTEGGQRLLRGERWKIRDVMHFTLIASSNEGAQILSEIADAQLHARYASSSVGNAAIWRMNDIARSLGLARTQFLNVSGLDISSSEAGAYGSARDMAKLFAYAATAQPDVFAGTARDGLLLSDTAGGTTAAYNTNLALGAIPGLIMGKTGFTDLAGGNLAVVFDAGLSQPVVAVVLGSTWDGRFSDMKTLVDTARREITRE